MAISSIGITQTTVTTQTVSLRTSTNSSSDSNAPQDSVSLGDNPDSADLTYTDPRKTTNSGKPVDLAGMMDESNRKVQAFTDMLNGMLQQQGLTWSKVVSGEQHLSADPATIEAAKQAVSDDGEFGVTNTAERILSFAKAAIGDDPSKLATIRAAVEKGFKDATDFFGGKLPDISEQTHAAITAEFDRWEKEGIPSGDKVTLSKPATSDSTTQATTDQSGSVAG
ncbi:hypothetical protein SAMN02745857_04116 [Andreprevotia lacus DSM 23236]|jgi:hypothetical protein|uniref:DUF5610 domain-containing protein n=1 Tax=Andreprevotia lacus DSM 23236 TaxID=1121001 RepID=A0A1W1Y0W6_9NEIS|nr:hypothetical protein [Andreprevotia lacus]SMC29775.1 hypothetical protein SAMN02745857_04116 [Andreprevotia lacus DSM 23236]